MKIPQRWQRSRKAGAKQPDSCCYCGRQNGYSKYANPHTIEPFGKYFMVWDGENWKHFIRLERIAAHQFSVQCFKKTMRAWLADDPTYFDALLNYDYISCWCSPDLPCHCDAIIEHLQKRVQELQA